VEVVAISELEPSRSCRGSRGTRPEVVPTCRGDTVAELPRSVDAPHGLAAVSYIFFCIERTSSWPVVAVMFRPRLVPISRVTYKSYKSRHFKSVLFGCSDL
jgi:hypothetical protein